MKSLCLAPFSSPLGKHCFGCFYGNAWPAVLTLIASAGLIAQALAADPAGRAEESFEGYGPRQTFTTRQFLGEEAPGWVEGWRTGGSYSLPVGTVTEDAPVDQGQYLSAKIATQKGHDASSGAITRPFEISDDRTPVTIRFRFRPDEASEQISYLIGDTRSASAFGPDSSCFWKIASVDGKWQFLDGGGGRGSGAYVDSGMAVTPGTVYEMVVVVDPEQKMWRATISNGSAHTEELEMSSRADFAADPNLSRSARWLTFAVKEAQGSEGQTTGGTGVFSVDSISITK